MEERSEPISRQHHRSKGLSTSAKLALAALVLLGAAYAWWQWGPKAQPDVVKPAVTAPQPAAPEPEAPATPAAAEPAPPESHPLEAAADAQGNPPLAADDAAALETAVSTFLGREKTLRFVATDGLARRIVATVDNLARKQAAARLWPLHPVGGRMAVTQTDDGGMQIAPANAARYDAVVGWVGSVDPVQVAGLYRRVYPVLQRTYEELGYPRQRFNDRLVTVIDHLLQTPEPAGSIDVKLVQVHGQVATQQPWLRYEFADADLQQLSAGQKILVRMGVAHTQRIKAWLQAVRAQITKG